jgi:hypothetical protein
MKQSRYVDTAALEALASLLFIEARNICVGCKEDVILNMGEDHGLRGSCGPQVECRAKKLRKLTKQLYAIIDEYKKANAKEHEFWKQKGAGK